MSSTVGNTILAMFGCKTTIQHFLWSRRTFLLLARFVRAFFSFFSQLSSSTIPERSAIAASLRRPPPTKDFFVEIIFLLRWLIDDARLQIWPNHLLELLFISGNCRCTIHTRKAEWIEINFHVGFLGRCASDFLPYSACRESAPSIDDFSEWKRHLTCKTLSSESGARSFVIFFLLLSFNENVLWIAQRHKWTFNKTYWRKGKPKRARLWHNIHQLRERYK